MPSQFAPDKKAETPTPTPDQDPVPLPCPRCDSTNTKFCYFNNYNFSQPRHFCKSCRRYWTQGGTLRDVPFGGASRKIAKRFRNTTTAAPLLVPHFSAGSISSSIGGVGGGNGFNSLLSGGGFGLGRGIWAFPEVGYLSGGATGVASGGGGGVSGESSGGDCFSFASFTELAIIHKGMSSND